jgi:CRP/FNR family transcriptional regulator, cyclic AMP receptor protein
VESLEPIVQQIELFRDLDPQHIRALAGCGRNVHYDAGTFAGRAGDKADHFWVIRQGRMALELMVPGRGSITVATMSDGDVVGFSWLLPPYQLRFDVFALTSTRALLFDGRCLRGKCASDRALGHELLKRFSGVLAARIDAMSLQLLDIYGEHPIEHQ